jgi:hypothetical protein
MTRDELTGRVFRGKARLVVLAPGVVHAFGAAADGPAKFLAVLTPGIVRFEYFRRRGRIARGEADRDSMIELRDGVDQRRTNTPRAGAALECRQAVASIQSWTARKRGRP